MVVYKREITRGTVVTSPHYWVLSLSCNRGRLEQPDKNAKKSQINFVGGLKVKAQGNTIKPLRELVFENVKVWSIDLKKSRGIEGEKNIKSLKRGDAEGSIGCDRRSHWMITHKRGSSLMRG